MPKIIAFAFMRQAFLISCSLACTETKQDWLLIFSTPWQLYFIKNESLLYKQQKTKAGDKFALPLPSMKASITMEETTEFAVHAGMFPTSMKVFRISGRDSFEFLIALNCQNCKLSERKANNSLCISQCTRTYSKKSKLDMDFCCSERHPGFPWSAWCSPQINYMIITSLSVTSLDNPT